MFAQANSNMWVFKGLSNILHLLIRLLSFPFSALTHLSSTSRCTVTTGTHRVFESLVRLSVFLSLASSSLGPLLSRCLCPWKIWKTPLPDPSPFHWVPGQLRSSAANSSLLTAGCSSARYHSSLVGSTTEVFFFFFFYMWDMRFFGSDRQYFFYGGFAPVSLLS